MHKYHSAGFGQTHVAVIHVRGELTEDAAARRLKEELGFETPLRKIFDFTYHALVENGLTEYEFDHVFFGKYSGEINFNTK
jgi:isopentenyl-diphosphate delta-isomerase